LKIDRSFVKNLMVPDRPAIVESILALARTLNTGVVAEGVEHETQARELERLGCTHAQGYLFSRPVSAKAAEEIIAARQPLGVKKAAPPDGGGGKRDQSSFDYTSSTFEWPEQLLARTRG
jgi:predicted signal transduction protein with EAL and GGDEF domain